MLLSIKEIRKSLMTQGLELSAHVQEEMIKRGYTKRDLIQCVWNGEVTEIQCHHGKLKALIEGSDIDGCPMCIVVGFSPREIDLLALVTAFPPIKKKFKRVI